MDLKEEMNDNLDDLSSDDDFEDYGKKDSVTGMNLYI